MAKQRFSANYPSIAQALKRAKEQKLLYEKNLVGKSFLYVYLNQSNRIEAKEMLFERKNFLHLTGLDYKHGQQLKRSGMLNIKTEAEEFYARLGNDDTLINDVSFIQGRNSNETALFFRYTQHKLDNLSQLTAIAAKSEFIGKYNGQQDFDVIVNRNRSAIAFIQSESSVYIPVSSLYGQAKDVASNIRPVLAVFSKPKDQGYYQLEYLNATINIKKRLVSSSLLAKLSHASFENPNQKFNISQQNALIHSYEVSMEKYIVTELEKIHQLRECAYDSETALDTYDSAFTAFSDKLTDEFRAKIALDALTKQYTEKANPLILDEYRKIKEKYPKIPTKELSNNIQYFQPKPLPDVHANGTIAIPKPSIRGTIADIFHHAKSAFRTLLHRNSNAKRPKKVASAKPQKKTISKPAARQPRPSSRQAEQSKSEKQQPTVSDPPSQSSKPRKKQGNIYFSVALLHESSRQIKENKKLKRERGEITPKKHHSDNELE